MNKKTPVPGYRLLSSPSTKLKLKDNHYETPCIRIRRNPRTVRHLTRTSRTLQEKPWLLTNFIEYYIILHGTVAYLTIDFSCSLYRIMHERKDRTRQAFPELYRTLEDIR